MHWKKWTGAVAVVASFSVAGVMAAQNPSSSSTARPSSSSASSAQGRTITVTGCLERGTQTASNATGSSTTGTTGTTGTASAQYILKENAPAGATGTTGSTAASSSSSMAKTYALQGHESELASHVNHQVEITGTPQPSANGASATASSPSGTATAMAGQEKLEVSSVRMVSATCTAK